MFFEFEPGDKVINPQKKDWGIGQIQSIIKNKVSIETLFREFGYQAIVFSPSIRVDKNQNFD